MFWIYTMCLYVCIYSPDCKITQELQFEMRFKSDFYRCSEMLNSEFKVSFVSQHKVDIKSRVFEVHLSGCCKQKLYGREHREQSAFAHALINCLLFDLTALLFGEGVDGSPFLMLS